MLPERLTLPLLKRFAGTLVLPGSKSLSNRILLLAALAGGQTQVTRLLHSEDVRVMLEALRLLGVPVRGEPGADHLTIVGQAGPLPGPGQAVRQSSYTLHLANAGTAMRPLTAVLCAGQGEFTLQGVPRMHERPIGDLVEGLRQLGAHITCLEREGYPPLHIQAAGLPGGEARISGATSSQYLSALLLAAPLARAPVTLTLTDHLVSEPYVQMTLALMERFGVRVERPAPLRYRVPAPQRYTSPGRVLVEGDASSASYFLAGAAITGGSVRVEGCGSDSLQGDARFAEVLERMGATVRWEPAAIEVTGPPAPALDADGTPAPRLKAVDLDLRAMPDAAMTLAVAALFADGPCTLRGIGNWRVKETDRMAAVATELGKLGARTRVEADTLTVLPPARLRPAAVATYQDHRMAMAFSLAACGVAGVDIINPGCVDKTFPTYFDELAKLTGNPAFA